MLTGGLQTNRNFNKKFGILGKRLDKKFNTEEPKSIYTKNTHYKDQIDPAKLEKLRIDKELYQSQLRREEERKQKQAEEIRELERIKKEQARKEAERQAKAKEEAERIAKAKEEELKRKKQEATAQSIKNLKNDSDYILLKKDLLTIDEIFKLFKIKKNDSKNKLKASRNELMMKFHPDRCPISDSNSLTVKILKYYKEALILI